MVQPIVVAPKPKSPGKVYVCVDMLQANKAIKRKHHVMLPIKEMIGDLNGTKVFTKLDLNQDYNQLELAPSCVTSPHLAPHGLNALQLTQFWNIKCP